MYKKILVPVDGSESTGKVLKSAAGIALEGTEITIFHVVSPIPPFIIARADEQIGVITEESFNFGNQILENATKELKEILAGVEGIKTNSGIVMGQAAEEIVKLAAEGNYDVIVIGSRGLGGFSGFLLGSVSNRVVRHSKTPVLVVR